MSSLIGGSASSVLTSTEATQGKAFGLGDRRSDGSGGVWVYIQASSSLALGDAVRVKADYKAAQLTIDTGKQAVEVGFVQVAFQIGDQGWANVGGRPLIRLASACQPSLGLYATTTGGVLDDTTTSVLIQGVVATVSVTAGATTAATCVAQYPQLSRAINV